MTTDRDEPTGQPIMCKNNCGFCGSPANENYCSKCYREHLKHKSQLSSSSNKSNILPTNTSDNTTSTDSTNTVNTPTNLKANSTGNDSSTNDKLVKGEVTENVVKKKDRCHYCNKLVGLLGFSCRCDNVFCSQHRQANLHDCEFDYKSFNKSQLERKSVRVVADKIQKI